MTDIQSEITAFWNARSTDYDEHSGHGILDQREHDAWIAALRDLVPNPPLDVLDVGTGTGMLALLLAEIGHRAHGIDLAEDMLAKARAKAEPMANPPKFEIGDAVEPPFPPQSFDAIVNRHVLWTLPDPARALANWRMLLRPGGRLVIIDGLWSQPAGEPKPEDDHGDPYSESTMAALPLTKPQITLGDVHRALESAGFSGLRDLSLDEIDRIEREHGGDDHKELPRYVIVATVPYAGDPLETDR